MSPNMDKASPKIHELKQELVRVAIGVKQAFPTHLVNQYDSGVLCRSMKHKN